MEDLDKPKVVMICGSTATGKSKLANALAREFSGEVVSADSMQIYQNLVIGTAAVTPQEADGVPQHLVGFLPPDQTFSVADYVKKSDACISNIIERGNLPIISGGTGLYLSAIQQGTIFSPEKPNTLLRKNLQDQLAKEGAQSMLDKLFLVDAEYAKTLHTSDEKRILRGLEQWELTGKTRAKRDAESKGEPKYNIYCIGLQYLQRESLYSKINTRVDIMVAEGLLDEAKDVFEHKDQYVTAAQSIGYKEYFPFFEGTDTLENCTEKLKQATRRYAKRQMTWFRSMPNIHWLEVEDPIDLQKKAYDQVKSFLFA